MQRDQNYVVYLVKYRLETAAEDLKAATVLFESNVLKAANNRAYYSIFHSIQAIHAMDGKEYRKHKDAIGNFNKEYVKTGIFSRDLGRRISAAEDVRHASDYDDFYIVSREITTDQIKTAEDLLEQVKVYCKKRQYGLISKTRQ